MRSRQSGQTLAATLVVLAIIAILAAMYFMPNGGKSTRADGKGTSTVGAALYKAKDTVCKSNISSVRQLIYIQTQTNGEDNPENPATLDDVRGISREFKSCPVGKEPYSYDPADGKVKCVHPGHEKY
jgi:hypothetical protein